MSSYIKNFVSRHVTDLITGRQTTDGGGFKLTRVFSGELANRLDPFLMLDAFNNDNPDDYIAGFPDHPHRGFETISYMLAGQMRHRDSAGNEGLIKSGGMQWMTAGSGLVHSEFPEQDQGHLAGFQLWLNLAAADKMQPPNYQDFDKSEIPSFITDDNITVRVLSGHSHDIQGAVQRPKTLPLYLDVQLPAEGTFIQTIPAGFNSFIYVYSGEIDIAGTRVPEQTMAILDNNQGSEGVKINAVNNAKILIIAGKPLNEPIVQQGPFVMNSQDELYQAFRDYRDGLFA